MLAGGLSMNDASDHLGGDRNENPDRYLMVVLGAAAADRGRQLAAGAATHTIRAGDRPRPQGRARRACASNWPGSCTTTTPAPSRADRAQRRPLPGARLSLPRQRLDLWRARRAGRVDPAIMDDGKSPERPRVEPEIIPPDRHAVRRGATLHTPRRAGRIASSPSHRPARRRAADAGDRPCLAAAGGLLLFGALLIWLPLVALILIIGAIAALLPPAPVVSAEGPSSDCHKRCAEFRASERRGVP